MDDIVLRAMTKWPDVPAVYGWLALDRRGRWRLQEQPFEHPGAVRFINRNYAVDGAGQWYFQNGPQRVYVELDYTPWVFSVDGAGTLRAHTGRELSGLRGAWLDETGHLVLQDRLGPGVVDDRDLLALSEAFVERDGRRCNDDRLESLFDRPLAIRDAALTFQWGNHQARLDCIAAAEVARRFGFGPRPTPSPSGSGA